LLIFDARAAEADFFNSIGQELSLARIKIHIIASAMSTGCSIDIVYVLGHDRSPLRSEGNWVGAV
jgi:hypothetical protein